MAGEQQSPATSPMCMHSCEQRAVEDAPCSAAPFPHAPSAEMSSLPATHTAGAPLGLQEGLCTML